MDARRDPEEPVSQNPNVEERTPDIPVALEELSRSLLDEAGANDNGRAALTLTPSEGGPLKQTILALRSGHELAPHTAPGPASIQVLQGTADLVVDGGETSLSTGAWAPIPREKHSLRAEEDTVALLTVVPNPNPVATGDDT